MKKKINKSLIRKIIKNIEAKPLRLEMGDYVDLHDGVAPCGTSACIAGWAVIIDRMEKHKIGYQNAAKLANTVATHAEAVRLLGITGDQSARLFFADEWPTPFSQQFYDASYDETHEQTRRREAKVAVARLNHFLKTGK